MTTDNAPVVDAPGSAGDIVAKPSGWYRAKWALVGVMALAYGWWSLYDGFVKWERENQQAIQGAIDQGKPPPEKLPHNQLGIQLNRLLGIVLQPAGCFLLFWAFYSSRGEYRLSGGSTLHAPGHPPVSLERIREIDKSKWDRKGIAYLTYEVPGPAAGTKRLKLDDYIYEREPTDRILERIEAALLPAERA